MKSLDDWMASAKVQVLTLSAGQGSLEYRERLPTIRCVDGTTLSVQAGEHLYCTPRHNQGPWTHVEVGYPSVAPGPTWTEYCEDPDSPCHTVYAYVPIHLVCFYIAAHGGFANDQQTA